MAVWRCSHVDAQRKSTALDRTLRGQLRPGAGADVAVVSEGSDKCVTEARRVQRRMDLNFCQMLLCAD